MKHCWRSADDSAVVFISYPAGHDVSSYWPLLLSSTHVPTMLLVPSVQLKEASAFLRAHSPSPSHTAPLWHVWHESASVGVSGSLMMR